MADSVSDHGSSAEDAALQRLLAGDDAAFAELFDRHRPRLLRMVGFRLDQRLRGRVDADDILQEAYLDGAKRLDSLRAAQPMSAFIWLRLIVGQTLIDIHRKHIGAQKRDAEREVSIQARLAKDTTMSLSFQLLGHLTSPSQAALKAELSRLVVQALDQMNPTDREILALRHFEELTNKEVSEVLGLDRKAASIRYIRALDRLKGVLQQVPGFFDDSATNQ